MPPPNDNLANATVISSGGSFSVSGSTIGATVEPGQETDDGYVDTVWYRIEPLADAPITVRIKNASYEYYAEIYVYPGGGTPSSFSDVVGPGYSNYITYLGTGTTADDEVTFDASGNDVYYVLVTNWDFIEGIEGTFTFSGFLPEIYECDAAPGANLSSPTVSVSGGWVLDSQVRSFVPGSDPRGDLDYTKTFEVSCPGCVPPGKWKVELLVRAGPFIPYNILTLVQMRKNGKPIGHNIGGDTLDTGVPTWITLTDVNLVFPNPRFPGPRYVDLKAGDVLSFCIGGWYEEGRLMEVKKVRFTSLEPVHPLPSWQQVLSRAETFPEYSAISISPWRAKGDTIYGFMDIQPGIDHTPALNIWTYRLDGRDIVPLSAPHPVDGYPWTDLHTAAPRPGYLTSTSPLTASCDFDVLPNGDIVAAWIEWWYSSSPPLNKVVLARWRVSTGSWEIVTDNLWNHGTVQRWATYISVEAAPDGSAVYIAWGEARQAGVPLNQAGYWWRCKRYTPSSGAITELGTSPSSGITAFPSAPANKTVDAADEYRLRIRVSPNGVPWVIWPSYDPDLPLSDWYERCFAYFWNGSTWVDSQVPIPSYVPPDLIDPITNFVYGSYSTGLGSGNYINYAEYGFWKADLTFCQMDGPNENPSIIYQLVYKDQTPPPWWDISGFLYCEYDGTPGQWKNEHYFVPGNHPKYGRDEPQIFRHRTSGFPEREVGAWTQGFTLTNDGQSPWLFDQSGYRASYTQRVYAGRIVGGEDPHIELWCHGWPDEETNSIGPAWSAPTTNGGVIVNGVPVCIYRMWDSFWPGVTLLSALPCDMGGIVSMNWRSSTRNERIFH